MMVDVANCTGCQACSLICPTGCIRMEVDHEGFRFPKIDKAECIDCKLCVLRCPDNSPQFRENSVQRVIGARLKDRELLLKSASGGVFAGIARHVLQTPGSAVFGCAFDKDLDKDLDKDSDKDLVARHVCVTDAKDIEPLQSSKYVESDVGDTYTQTKQLLEQEKTVLYSGTPCQIAGLYAFLGRDYDNLFTMDLICHGVPSPLLFKRYVTWLGKKHGGKVIDYSFRSKDKRGWGKCCKVVVKTKSKTKRLYPNLKLDPYYSQFLAAGTYRESCYVCKYSASSRVGDITIGDFWGVELAHPGFHSKDGVSVILVNSQKGGDLLNTALINYEIIESTFDNAAIYQGNLSKPTKRPEVRDTALQDIHNDDVSFLEKGCYRISGIKRIRQMYTFVPSFIRRAYRNIQKKAADS